MRILSLLGCGLVAISICLAAESEEQQKLNNAVEALTRLQNVNLEEKPAIKAAVGRALDRTRGTPNFVKLVSHFNLTDQNPGLLEVALKNSRTDSGVEAMKLLLASGGEKLVRDALESTNAVTVIEVLGSTREKQSVPWLAALVADEKQPATPRRAGVRALVQTQEGARALLKLAEEERLANDVKLFAANEVHSVRWNDIKELAAKVLPLPPSQNSEPLPPISELSKRSGDATKGAAIFRRDTTACISCHQVNSEGREVGPALSEIGTKLPKEALYEALLDPSAGISFGFEAWQVQLKDGDEAYGLKVSETPAEIAIRDAAGIVTRYKRSDIASLQQMKTSIMPSGLQQALTTVELVDLVEYLASLKKK